MGNRKKSQKEFVDKNHPVISEYYGYLEKMERGEETYEEISKRMKRLIKKDPDFLDSYLTLYEIYMEIESYSQAHEVLDKAFKRAVDMITDKEGNWPEKLEWGWLENRHIIRTILNKALFYWNRDDTNNALYLLRKLLRSNPGDNIGARDFILAIRMGMGYREFEKRFNRGGYYDSELTDWFEKNYKKFSDEFGWWEKGIEENYS